MVTLRGKADADPESDRPDSGAPSPQASPKSSVLTVSNRAKTPGPSNGFLSEDDGQKHVEDEEGNPLRTITRRSPRLRNTGGSDGVNGKRRKVRRSTRPTRPTCRYQASPNMADSISTNVAEAVLKRADDMKKRRQLSSSEEGICSEAQRRKTLSEDLNGEDEEDDEEDDEEEDDEEDDEEDGVAADSDNGSGSQSFDAILNGASGRFQASNSESLRGSYRISASGPNTTTRTYRIWATSRTTKSAWASKSGSSDEDADSDDDEQSGGKIPGRCEEDLLGTHRDRRKVGAGLADIDPMLMDQAVGFNSVGGLSGHISALKEMVVFPLLYPEVFDNFKIQPPRGCLFYGPPGTGKTLVARALANECSHGDRKVAFFMRKGADCLSKWVGESERQLRLLFDQAYQMRPSIIFFDEIDGLAPVRSSRQDQIHSSIVSTLLALMDGLDSRGEVVVIGATNRLDAIDPALRRPGRFDREFLFGLPDRESRREILNIHTRQWKPPPSEDFLDQLAEKCVGYCGADIRAVCTEAVLCALRRRYPQIYGTSQKLLLDVSSIAVSSCDFVAAMRKIVPASQRPTASPAMALSPVVHPLLGAALHGVLEALQRLFPYAEQGLKRKREQDLNSSIHDDDLMYNGDEASSSCSISTPSSSRTDCFLHFARSVVNHPTSHRPRMLLAGRPGAGQSSHLAPAVLHALEKFPVHNLDMAVLFGVSSTSPEEACAQVFREAKRTSPSVLYIPHIQQCWETAGLALRAMFLSLLDHIPSFCPVLLLATSSVPHHQLAVEIQSLFRVEFGEVQPIGVPTQQERTRFFEDLILNQAAKSPASKKKALMQAMEILPLAPPPPCRQLSEQERLRMEEEEEDALRELRLFLRNVTERLSLDRRFKAFTKPVDIEEVPDYLTVIERPMDLSTVLSNIDLHKYVTVNEFVSDVDLIWQNALEYNPDNDPWDRHIRHRACALKDAVHAIIRNELDGDFEKICEEIKESRIKRGCTSSRFAPYNYRTQTKMEDAVKERINGNQGNDSSSPITGDTSRPGTCKKKRYKQPRRSKWSTDVIKRSKKKNPPTPPSSPPPSSCSSSSKDLTRSEPEEDKGMKQTEAVETTVANGRVSNSADPSSSPSESVGGASDGGRPSTTATMYGVHRDPDLHGVAGTPNRTQSHPLVDGCHWTSSPKGVLPEELDPRQGAQTFGAPAKHPAPGALEQHQQRQPPQSTSALLCPFSCTGNGTHNPGSVSALLYPSIFTGLQLSYAAAASEHRGVNSV